MRYAIIYSKDIIIFRMQKVCTKYCLKYNKMSNNNINAERSFSTREDKIIQSTIVLYEDNEKKLK